MTDAERQALTGKKFIERDCPRTTEKENAYAIEQPAGVNTAEIIVRPTAGAN